MLTTHSPSAELLLLAIDASWASVAEREPLRYDGKAAFALLSKGSTIDGLDEAVILSTCNRTEFYLVASPQATMQLRRLLDQDCPGETCSRAAALREVRGEAVARHLFEVASGVASVILGDSFIIRQLKEALALASSAGTLGPVLSRLFELAFQTGRSARRHTAIGRGETGLGAVVATAIGRGAPAHPRILLVGAGSTARDIARQIGKRRVGSLRIVNRTRAHGERLALTCGAACGDWDNLAAEVASADVVVCAVGAPEPIISTEMLGDHRPLLVDVGVPRNIEVPPGSVSLVVDDLVASQDLAYSQREAAVADVHAIVDESVASWHTWTHARTLEGRLKALFQSEAEVRKQLAADLVSHGWHGTLGEAEQFVARRTAPLLKRHAAELRQWARQVPPPQARAGARPAQSMRA